MPSPFVEILAALAQTFEEAGLRWYLFGAQAAILYGAARLTADVDVTVQLGDRSVNALVDALGRHGFLLRVDDPDFIAQTRVLPVAHSPSGIPADIVLAGPGMEEVFLARAKVFEMDGVAVPVACAEDIVVMKLLSGRPKDLDDVVAILAANPGDLDRALIRSTTEMLEEALGQSDLTPMLESALARVRHPGEGSAAPPSRNAPSKPKRKRTR
ncbi:MAG: hypothetical protein IPK82_29330 [Polyangiaceae bacterium]|nr:hypothetical protein [Polyangiaceae bacterium]